MSTPYQLTVGHIRALIKDMPDDKVVIPMWEPGCEPADTDPAVTLHGFEACAEGLIARVSVHYLDDDEDWNEDEAFTDATCVDNTGLDNITVGHVYEILGTDNADNTIEIMDDFNKECSVKRERFTFE